MTVFFNGCPGRRCTVERVVQVDVEPAALDAGPQRRPRHRQPGARVRDDVRRLRAREPSAQLDPGRDAGDQVGHPGVVHLASGDGDLHLGVVGAGEVEPREVAVAQVVGRDEA